MNVFYNATCVVKSKTVAFLTTVMVVGILINAFSYIGLTKELSYFLMFLVPFIVSAVSSKINVGVVDFKKSTVISLIVGSVFCAIMALTMPTAIKFSLRFLPPAIVFVVCGLKKA